MEQIKFPEFNKTYIFPDFSKMIKKNVFEIDLFPVLKKTYSIPIFPKLKYSRNLNAFKQLNPSETQHSKIICDLIAPNNQNNEDAGLFLKLFFEIVLKDNNFQNNPNDIWEVTAEKERYDIRIRNKDNSKIIIIENKSNWAEDKDNQLYRYWYFGIHKPQENIENPYCKILYLSPSDYKPYSKQSITRPENPNDLGLIEYSSDLPMCLDEKMIKTVFYQSDISQWLDACINVLENDLKKKANTYYYLLQYKDFWRDTMANEIVQQVEEHFKGMNQWNSFVELANQKQLIITTWLLSLKNALHKCFLVDNVNDKWGFESLGNYNWDYYWFLNEFGRDSLRIWLYQQTIFLWINPETLDLAKGKELLKAIKYSKIIGAFENTEKSYLNEPQNSWVFAEIGNFVLNDIEDNHIPLDKFAWYSHYNTEVVVEQILRKINRFREPEITDLLKELIIEIKK